MATADRSTVTIATPSGLTLVADHWTGEREPIVLAHGGGQTRHSWGATAAALADRGHRVMSIDLRGHGDSQWAANGEYGMHDFVEDHLAVIDWIGEPVHWVGASLGGSSGLETVGASAEQFISLVLVDITPAPAAAGVDRILTFMAETAASGFADLDEAADAIAVYQPHRRRPADTSGLAKNLRQGGDGRWRWHWDPAFVTSPNSMTQQAGRHARSESIARALTLPTMLVRGRLSDLVTETEAAAFLEMVPHAEYVDVADAAHMIAGDKNDAFMAAVTDFIDQVRQPPEVRRRCRIVNCIVTTVCSLRESERLVDAVGAGRVLAVDTQHGVIEADVGEGLQRVDAPGLRRSHVCGGCGACRAVWIQPSTRPVTSVSSG